MNKYRSEIKLRMNPFDRKVLTSRLSHVLQKDKHTGIGGYYLVRSIYFDDDSDTALMEKFIGVRYREKYRIRSYNHSHSFIKLEKKVKNNNGVSKESALLTRKECESLLNNQYDFLKARSEMVCKQLYCKMRTGLFKPKTIVEYQREAYVWNPGRVRITIDSNIRTGINSTDFLNFNIPLANAIDNNTSILEIKYDYFLPAFISNLIFMDSRHRGSFSKYALCRKYG